MNDLTEEQIAELRIRLSTLHEELAALLEKTREGTRPVALDEPIGRLTRMDAIQQQSMSAANRRQMELRLRQVAQALEMVRRGEYGPCRRCEDPIGYARLSVRPESSYCLAGATVQKGQWMNVSKKVGGKWMIHCDIWNTNVPE